MGLVKKEGMGLPEHCVLSCRGVGSKGGWTTNFPFCPQNKCCGPPACVLPWVLGVRLRPPTPLPSQGAEAPALCPLQ